MQGVTQLNNLSILGMQQSSPNHYKQASDSFWSVISEDSFDFSKLYEAVDLAIKNPMKLSSYKDIILLIFHSLNFI